MRVLNVIHRQCRHVQLTQLPFPASASIALSLRPLAFYFRPHRVWSAEFASSNRTALFKRRLGIPNQPQIWWIRQTWLQVAVIVRTLLLSWSENGIAL